MSGFKLPRSRSRKQRDGSPGKPQSRDSSPPVDGAVAMNGHDMLKLKYGLNELEMKNTIGEYKTEIFYTHNSLFSGITFQILT